MFLMVVKEMMLNQSRSSRCYKTQGQKDRGAQNKNEVLSAEKSATVNSIKVHEDKISRLVEENEKNNFQQAGTKLVLVDSKLDDRDRDIAELQQKVLVKQGLIGQTRVG